MKGRTEGGPSDKHFGLKWIWHAVAAAVYLCTALAVSWRGVDLSKQLLGGGTDPFIYVWFLAWWPFALLHHLDPFFTHLVWQPEGLKSWLDDVNSHSVIIGVSVNGNDWACSHI